MQIRPFLFLISCLIFSITYKANQIDSLEKLLQTLKSDTARFRIYKALTDATVFTDAEKSHGYAEQMLSMAEKTGKGKGKAFVSIGLCEEEQGNYKEALNHYFSALKVFEKEKQEGWEKGIAKTNEFIGGVYSRLKSFEKAREYKEKAIEQYKKIGDREGVAIATFNLGNIFLMVDDFENAIEKIKDALTVFIELDDQASIATAYNSIGSIYYRKGKYPESLEYHFKAYRIHEQAGRPFDHVISLMNIGETYDKLGVYDSALVYEDKSRVIAEENGFLNVLPQLYENLSIIYSRKNNAEKAFQFMRLSSMYKDSLYTTETQRQLQELSVKYETDKKVAENKILNLELSNERIARYILFGASGLVLIIAFFVYRAYRIKKLSNRVLEIKNMIIEEKNRVVETQHKDITDSIHYAKRIQTAILPPDKMWFSILPDSFVLYKPKDILSGDFYWIEETTSKIFFAAADCTGHGVPGALMSVVNFNLLNKAVLEMGIENPGKILDAVNNWLTLSLHQTYQESTVRDGMDISLCAVDKQTKRLYFSGANNPMYLVRNGKLEVYSGDSHPVGAFMEEQTHSFSDKSFEVVQNDVVYLFSDGYADQFGGPKGKKFKYRQLQEKILSLQHLTLQKQKHELASTFEEWKGGMEQIDDVLVIGVNLSTV